MLVTVFHVDPKFLMLVTWPTSQTCHQHIWSPTSVTNINVTFLFRFFSWYCGSSEWNQRASTFQWQERQQKGIGLTEPSDWASLTVWVWPGEFDRVSLTGRVRWTLNRKKNLFAIWFYFVSYRVHVCNILGQAFKVNSCAVKWTVKSMLVTDVGDEMCRWQL